MAEEDYDALRQKNIAERNAIFAEFFGELKKQKTDTITEVQKKHEETYSEGEERENQPPKKRRRTISTVKDNVRNKTVRLEFRKKYNTRSRGKASKLYNENDRDGEGSTDEDTNSKPNRNGPKLRVLFPWAKSQRHSNEVIQRDVSDVDEEDEFDYDYDTDNIYKKRHYKVSKSEYDPNSIPSVEEITEDMLENIAQKSSGKQYCKVRGTSCHQCRQKTLDTKTVCRSGECIGVRGMFCGPCLRGRYGESAYDALKDPNWVCPPCRGLCNCSICRTRSGLRPTGILAPAVREEGFTSVLDYLQKVETDEM